MDSESFAYDENGNMLTGGGRVITWDAENRPFTIVKDCVTTAFVYDGAGKRVKQIVDGVETVYVNQYYEKNITSGKVTTSYYLGSKLIAVRKGPDLSYILQDHLGSTTGTVDSSGASTGAIHYFSFGDCLESTESLPTDKLFTGQRLESTGLYYYNSRYYDPEIGRFISADTIVPDPANPQSLNRYSYCLNNPLRYIDPDGHDPYMDYICLISHHGNPEPSTSPGFNKRHRSKIYRTTVFVSCNYVGGDSGIETLDSNDMKIWWTPKTGQVVSLKNQAE